MDNATAERPLLKLWIASLEPYWNIISVYWLISKHMEKKKDNSKMFLLLLYMRVLPTPLVKREHILYMIYINVWFLKPTATVENGL